MRGSLRWLLESLKLNVQTYASAQDFLSVYDPVQPGCLVLDVRMPGLSGLDLQAELASRNIRTPIIFITGNGDIRMSVKAMKNGATDFLTKPFSPEQLAVTLKKADGGRWRIDLAVNPKDGDVGAIIFYVEKVIVDSFRL